MNIEFGSLVRSQDNDLGIGKFIALSDTEATVEYFCSIGQQIKTKVALTSLELVRLQRQTRCYINSEQATWLIGRIYNWDDHSNTYQIDLPNSMTVSASELEVYVLCNRPSHDPIETLAMKAHETPYFHDRRLAFSRCLIEQRAVCRGMTGLISANIELYPHQVEVVRRVLEDPLQRYLLADEVGLGKTIEAGVILRQYLLDVPHGRVVILVPQYLLEQWHQELQSKFYLDSKQVQLLAVDDVNQVNLNHDLDFLILDEAHHIAAMASSSDIALRRCFATCKRLAHKSERLLLLSATPVLNHEQDFLTMLHLLDPATYPLDDKEGFRERIQKRQEIGRVLLSFTENAKPFVLKTTLATLQKLFPEDSYLLSLMDELTACLAQGTEIVEREQIIRAIRIHISDTYRLHRRMLRNRRASVQDVLFQRLDATESPLKVEYDLDERSPDIHELIDEWRNTAPDEQYQRIFLLLFRASGTSYSILKEVIEARLKGVSHPGLVENFGSDVQTLIKTPKFAGEENILRSLLKTVQQPSEDGDRLELLKMVLLNQLSLQLKIPAAYGNPDKLINDIRSRLHKPLPDDSLPKIIVFTSFTRTCEEIFQSLSATFGNEAVASHQSGRSRQEVEANVKKFRQPNCFVLVCDRSGEEGRNLQFADWLIHFDLPWSPNQLEQRIGRLDRIGRRMAVQSRIFVGPDLPDSAHDAWYQLLKDGFGIFQQSVASLQFYVDEKLLELEAALFRSGAAGLLEMIEPVQQEIAQEEVKISEQNALDEIDAQDQTAIEYFKTLDDYDARHQEIQRAVEGWIYDALQFQRIYEPNKSGILRYQPTMRTLIPVDDLKIHFASHVSKLGTYNRRIANQHGVNLYRIGEELVESLASYVQGDDRGQAFAMWRHDENWDAAEGMEWVGFRFNYVWETDLTNEAAKSKDKAVQRRADALFPPILETVFLDAQMEIVEDVALVNVLQRGYKGNSHYRDYNLAKSRLPIIDEFIDPSQWADFCRKARITSETLLRDRTSFIQRCEQYAKIATSKLEKRLTQIRLRLNRLSELEESDSGLAEELTTETTLTQALLEGIRHPRLSLDSVGFIIVSGQPPKSIQDLGD